MSMRMQAAAVGLVGGMLLASGAYAGPITLTEAQLDAVAAGGVGTEIGFVCPVISTDAVLNSPKGGAIYGGDFTILGPTVYVPVRATNDNGAGAPGGPHVGPGDTGYTAIWNGPPPS